MKLLDGKQVMVGVIDVATDQVETPEQVADTIGLAMKYVPKENIIACTNCGLAPLDGELAVAKPNALGAGARIARERCRSEESRVGKEGVSTGRSRWSR